MKKIYALLIMGSTFTGYLSAQQTDHAVIPNSGPALQIPAAGLLGCPGGISHNPSKHLTSTNSTYFHEVMSNTDAVYNFQGGSSSNQFSLYLTPAFVDSTVEEVYPSATTQYPVWLMKAGGIFDPTSPIFSETPNTTPHLNRFNPYTIDTLWIAGRYEIHNPSQIGDTLQIEISWGPPSAASTWFNYKTVTTAAPVVIHESIYMPINTVSLAPGNKSFSTAPASNSITLKYPFKLTDSLSTNNYHYYYYQVIPPHPISIPAGNIVGIQYTMAPKGAYAPGAIYFSGNSSVHATMNNFTPLYYEETGLSSTNSGHHYFYDSLSYGMSGSYDLVNRYGRVNPGIMYALDNDGYLYQLAISSTLTGIDELSRYGVSLSQNYPNPFNQTSEIAYELVNTSPVVFSVTDILGREISRINLGTVAAGKHSLTLNGADFSKGVYFYTLYANGTSLSKRMIVTE
jgi:hypothetical protein